MASIGPIITIIGSILLVLLNQWQDGQPKRDQEKRDAEVNQGRADLLNVNTAAVTERLGRVLDAEAQAGGGNAGSSGGTGKTGGSVTACRLAAFGISAGEATGKG